MSDAPELPEEDVVAELRALYARLQPPPLADDVDAADAETARVVGWMQGAWRALDVPPARVPRGVVLPRPARPRVSRRAIAVAAGLLLVIGGALLVRAGRRAPDSRADAVVARRPEPSTSSGVEVLVVGPERLELRSGPVRLVLLDPPTPTTDQTPGG